MSAKRSRIASWGRWSRASVRIIRLGDVYYVRFPCGWYIATPTPGLADAIILADYAAG